jgi:nucleoid-associated protein YgaU
MDKRMTALATLALGALGVYYFWPKKASAAEMAKMPAGEPAQPLPPAGGTASGTFTDPGSGATLVGPGTPIPPTTTLYRIARGDTWSGIASRLLSDWRWWPALWIANRANPQFANPELLNPGDQIQLDSRIPQTADKAQVFSMAAAHETWRRGGKRGPSPLLSM